MFEKKNAYFQAHIDEFRKKYLDKELVIVGNKVVAVYNDFGRAYREPAKTYKPGPRANSFNFQTGAYLCRNPPKGR
jgi:hypothetical protein